ncbi:MAG: cobyric acid synthase [Armatimonadota bacterium]
MTSQHGGNLNRLARASGRRQEDIIDFSANINPLGPPEWMRPVISSCVSSLIHYPDPDCIDLTAAAVEHYGVSAEELIFGNGSTEIIRCLPRITGVKRSIIPVPAYSDYALASELAGLSVEKLPMSEDQGFALDLARLESLLKGDEMVFIGQPNNPTGLLVDTDHLRELAIRNPDTIFIVDEAFADFVEDFDSITVDRPSNVVALCSLTKFYAIPGLRLGCAIADRILAERVRDILPTWSVNTLAQAVGTAALRDNGYSAQTREFVNTQRNLLLNALRQISGIAVYEGKANFLMVKLNCADIDASELARRLLLDGIAIRVCGNFDGLDGRFFRVAVRTEDENTRLVRALKSEMGLSSEPCVKRRTPSLMFQGTSSNAGKSVLTAALCRILLQDGYSVAPFKAQNMSLNSYVTRGGGEMGRAQVVQAQACRIDPDVRMNPILLKPNSDTGSQIIVCGKPVGNMDFREYTRFKSGPFEEAKKCYDSLASEYDVIVLEGAGSPGEVNLKSRDIVNMRMARYANAPVMLVGDIDRGGVYASFVGTMEVLAEWERALVSGFIVNRFRGTASLLQDAHDYVLRHTGRPVMGVVPYLRELGLPEEDSVSFKAGVFDETNPEGECVDIALIDLPHISNFTDFDSLRIEPDVRLRIMRNSSEFGNPDAVILPGSKNVIGDLVYLRQTGLADKILELARKNETEIIGVCGGFQILGEKIADPHHVESAGRVMQALGLIPVSTVLAPEKTLTRVAAKHLETGLPLYGYEIHHGVTSGNIVTPMIVSDDGTTIGMSASSGLIWGTYLHGLFDADKFRRWFIDRLRVRRGLEALGHVCASYDLEPAFDRLADVVRDNIDLDSIYRIMGLR